jgi:hypothetical protein
MPPASKDDIIIPAYRYPVIPSPDGLQAEVRLLDTYPHTAKYSTHDETSLNLFPDIRKNYLQNNVTSWASLFSLTNHP